WSSPAPPMTPAWPTSRSSSSRCGSCISSSGASSFTCSGRTCRATRSSAAPWPRRWPATSSPSPSPGSCRCGSSSSCSGCRLDNDDSRVRIELSPAAAVEQLLSVGQIRRARELAAETVAGNPDDPLSYFVLGRVLLAMADAKGALVALEQALEREPEWDAAWALYASALFR